MDGGVESLLRAAVNATAIGTASTHGVVAAETEKAAPGSEFPVNNIVIAQGKLRGYYGFQSEICERHARAGIMFLHGYFHANSSRKYRDG
jgi:hypothetical protein